MSAAAGFGLCGAEIHSPGLAFPFGHSPKLSVVVVKKRIATRFFANIGGKTTNPVPGTVIDTEVTRPEW